MTGILPTASSGSGGMRVAASPSLRALARSDQRDHGHRYAITAWAGHIYLTDGDDQSWQYEHSQGHPGEEPGALTWGTLSTRASTHATTMGMFQCDVAPPRYAFRGQQMA
ncbi:hypothetical protein JZ751_021737 [Albula glossodonta]|uniref:Uncharacterized protein n=1 Tax=Albula glossodonta TaxID=121402 RepID=A0A8T2NM39_9TELE|nr:hypothetical protein JZ751_021737 [Albula glossodonta]